ncbi:DMT family transporter [Knoellia koreensis]|uniref:DMT family transporter n=1 Tax=Knoellia koreensis TaxID=2730921 RepID=A0A849HCU9_9MICO|nr:DMT family transporter [Knoellia sp. DB2414S]NNM44879.1 DMT family transporter [Knoellia sp. DB2414S]
MDSRTRSLTLGAIAVTLLLWASAFVAIRHLGGSVSPGALSLGRLLVASLVLGVMVWRRPRRWPTRRDLPLLLACGVLWFGVYNVALNAAEQRIDAGTAAMLVQIGPIIVAVLAAVFLGEPLTRWLVVGAVVGFAGVVVIGLGSSGHATGDLGGVALAVLAAVTYGAGVVTQKPLLSRLPTLEVTFLACVIGAVVCLPWTGDLVSTVRTATPQTLLLVAYLGVFPTAIAFSTWGWALARSNAGSLALTTFLVPVIATVMGWLFLGELPPAAAYLGGVLCVVGVLLTRRKPRVRDREKVPA